MTKKIVFVTNSALIYGGELSLLEILKALRLKDGISILVVVPKQGDFSRELKKLDVAYVIIPHFKWTLKEKQNIWVKNIVKKIANYFAYKSLKKACSSFGANIVYTNSITNNLGAKVAQTLDIPHLWHLREFLHEDIGTQFLNGVEKAKALINHSSLIVCNSEAIKRSWQSFLNNDALTVIYNGFPFISKSPDNFSERYLSTVKNADCIKIAIIGSINKHKNQALALRTMALLKSEGVEVYLQLFGDGTEEYISEMKTLSRDLSIADCIEWKGYVPEPFELMQDTAITIMCSKNEAFGRVLVESMAKGIPVVAPKCGGVPEIIDSGATGLLYEVDSSTELASCIKSLISNEKLYSKLSAQGYQSVYDRFSVETYLRNIERALSQISQ